MKLAADIVGDVDDCNFSNPDRVGDLKPAVISVSQRFTGPTLMRRDA
jgi:hypothetical protein